MAGVGMPAELYLDHFGYLCTQAFGAQAYQVGSSMGHKPQYRDVDVRVILKDEAWEKMGLGTPGEEHTNPRWRALTMAFTALGREMTGLPIDFQLQQMTYANKEFPKGGRSALGVNCYFANKEPLGYWGEYMAPDPEPAPENA